ncbi:SDR family oxidoreductase [Chitinivorax sp. PXF-14]|uniref:SDR family oxidoreductase n=1 Tax=Chitinivorax sp. PXF-14 TaxID=3230488 RepID=UPI003464EF4C
MVRRIALVTGANRGMGLETARALAEQGMTVLLSARDATSGRAAAEPLQAAGLDVRFRLLDVANEASIRHLADEVSDEFGRLDVLVNNAGQMIGNRTLGQENAGKTLLASCDSLLGSFTVNTLGPFLLCQAFIPLMMMHGYGRIVNVASGMGSLTDMHGAFGTGWPGYRISKTALNAVTRVFAAELEAYRNIKINSVCPGWVNTAMGGGNAPRSVAQGIETTVWLATLPEDGPSGQFYRDREAIAW